MSVTVSVFVPAAPSAVWERLVDIPGWPLWNPACASATLDTPHLTEQSVLRLELVHPRSGRRFWTSPRIDAIEPNDRLALVTKALGFRAPMVFTLTAHEDGTGVDLVASSRGPLAFSYRLTFPERAQGLLWSGALTGLAASFTE